jgi:hypothetical protein
MNVRLASKLVPACLLLLLLLPDVRATPDAKRLYDDLLSGYNRSRTV